MKSQKERSLGCYCCLYNFYLIYKFEKRFFLFSVFFLNLKKRVTRKTKVDNGMRHKLENGRNHALNGNRKNKSFRKDNKEAH